MGRDDQPSNKTNVAVTPTNIKEASNSSSLSQSAAKDKLA